MSARLLVSHNDRYDEPHEAGVQKIADEALERDVRVPLLDSFDSPLAMATSLVFTKCRPYPVPAAFEALAILGSR
jgi:hypothetical protein